MKKRINSFKRRREMVFIATSLLILVLLSIFPAAASVNDWNLSSQTPISGDTIIVKGSAFPGEKIDVFVNFKKTVPISEGQFEYNLENVNIPEGFNNFFKVEANGVKNLNVRAKMSMWITKSSEASGDIAIVSQSNVSPGTYKIKINGDVGEGVSEVNLNITASQKIEADSMGNFYYSYDTKSVPYGNFEIKVGDITKEINVQPKETTDLNNISFSRINFTDRVVYVLDHSNDPWEGNWIMMGSPYDGRKIQLPQPIAVTYSGPGFGKFGGVSVNLSSGNEGNYTINYPANSSTIVYIPGDKVNMSFFGNSSLKGQTEIYVFNASSKSTYGIIKALNTESFGNLEDLFNKIMDKNYKKYHTVLGKNGDLLDYDLGAFEPGQYYIVMIQKNDTRSLTVLSATAFVVAEYELKVLAPESIEKGNNLDIGMELVNAPQNINYTYGAILINEQAYKVDVKIDSNGTKNGTSLKVNGIDIFDEFDINSTNYKSKLTRNELQKELQTLIGEGNGSIATGENGQQNISLTAFELPTGNYHLLVGAYDPKGKIAGLSQLKVEIVSLQAPAHPVANFTSSVTTGYAPLSIQFTDTSANAAEWLWNFGDGTNSTEQNPVHTYYSAGNYTVNLTATNITGIDSKLATITVTALEQPAVVLPIANFSSNVVSGYYPLSVQYIDASKNSIEWNWDFGDGARSTQQNPEHVYLAAGNYTVALTASNANGTSVKTATISVLKTTGPYAYITNYYNNSISIIDTTTNSIVTTVPVGRKPFGVAVSPDGEIAYTTNLGGNTVSVINAITNNVIATVNVGKRPYGVAVNQDGTKVYVTNELSNTVSIIDTATNTITATVPAGKYPSGIAVSPDGTKVYVANEEGTVSVIDTATSIVTATVIAGDNPLAVAVSPDGTKVYVTNYGSNTVSIIDTPTNTITATVDVGSRPGGIAVSPDGTKVYVTNELSDSVSVIDATANAVIATVNVGNSLWGVAVSPDGTKVYVANENNNTVSVIDTATNIVTAAVSVGSGPIAFGKFIGPILVPMPVCNTSTIYGYSFNDSNINKKKNTKEAGLSNMVISLNGYDTCKGRLVSETTKTNLAGYYEFNGIGPGIYVVSESFIISWLPTTNAAHTLTVSSSSTSIQKDFGNIKFVK